MDAFLDKIEGLPPATDSQEDLPKMDQFIPSENPLTIQDLRSAALQAQQRGKKEELKALVQNYGVSRVTEVKEPDWKAFLAECVDL